MGRLFVLLCFLLPSNLFANDLSQAPSSFQIDSGKVVPIDITSVDVDYNFNYTTKNVETSAVMRFNVEDKGLPMFDLVPSITSLELNDEHLEISKLLTVRDPDSTTKVRVLDQELEAGSHVIRVEFALDREDVTFSSGKVRAGFFMSDLARDGRSFFEQYGPANYEYDQIKFRFKVRMTGVSKEHRVYTNGTVVAEAENSWIIDFPDYFTTSSIYFHISEKGRFYENEFVIEGKENEIPVIVYAASNSLVQTASRNTKQIISELEADYGATIHKKYVIYVTSGGGGMEYGGATMTSMSALGHELTHSWFARGVMPSKGNSGWIDEAVASWRDRNYYRANSEPRRSPVNLGGFSQYRRHTSTDAYTSGRQLMSEFDFMFKDGGGMKPVLRALYEQFGGETIDLSIFKNHVETVTGMDLTAIFNRYVKGKANINGFNVVAPERMTDLGTSTHPRPYTANELKKFR